MLLSSLQSKITVGMFVLVIVSTLTGMVLIASLLLRSHEDSVKRQLEATGAALMTLGITHFSELSDFEKLNTFIEDALQIDKIDKIVRIYDSSKQLIFTTLGQKYDTLPTSLDKEVKKPIFMIIDEKNERYESLIIPYDGKRSRHFYLQVAMPLPKYHDIFDLFWRQGLLAVGLLITISLVLSRLLAALLIRPVRIIAEHIQTLDPATVDSWYSIEEKGQGEYLGPITSGINSLMRRTQAAVYNLRKMTRYVAHELRTPLTILQGEAEMLLNKKDASKEDYERVLKSSQEEIKRMSEIVTTVLKVGEHERIMDNFQPQNIDLVRWLQENKTNWDKLLKQNIGFKSTNKFINVYVDPKLLFRLVDNLVRNIKEHTPRGTLCSMRLEHSFKSTKLYVSDNGQGLHQKMLESLNNPAKMLSEIGIGLSLCTRIAEVSNLNLLFSNLPSGGLEVEIDF